MLGTDQWRLVIVVTPSPRGGGQQGPSDDRRQQSQPQLSGDFIWRQASRRDRRAASSNCPAMRCAFAAGLAGVVRQPLACRMGSGRIAPDEAERRRRMVTMTASSPPMSRRSRDLMDEVILSPSITSCAHAELRPLLLALDLHKSDLLRARGAETLWMGSFCPLRSAPFRSVPRKTGIWLETIVVTIAGNQGNGHEACSCSRSSASAARYAGFACEPACEPATCEPEPGSCCISVSRLRAQSGLHRPPAR